MKKLVFIAAAVAAIASCAKVETINTSTPQQIAFEGYNFGMTKANHTLTGSLGVIAYKSASDNLYFDNTQFTAKGHVYTGDKYWPRDGKLDFLLYAPYGKNAIGSSTKNSFTTKDVAADTDLLYGEKLLFGQTKAEKAMDITMKHAKCMVEVKVVSPSADLFKINNVNFGTQATKGDVEIIYDDETQGYVKKSAKWTVTETKTPLTVGEAADVSDVETPFIKDLYLIPNDVNAGAETQRKIDKLIISYQRMNEYGESATYEDLTKTLSGLNIALTEGKKYVFTLTFSADEIQFNPSVEDWTVVEPALDAIVTPDAKE